MHWHGHDDPFGVGRRLFEFPGVSLQSQLHPGYELPRLRREDGLN